MLSAWPGAGGQGVLEGYTEAAPAQRPRRDGKPWPSCSSAAAGAGLGQATTAGSLLAAPAMVSSPAGPGPSGHEDFTGQTLCLRDQVTLP